MCTFHQVIQLFHQLVKASLFPGNGAGHRYAQLFRQPLQVNGDILAGGFVHQVHAYQDPVRYFHGLKYQVQVALQAGGVAHNHNPVASAKTDKVAGHFLLRGVGHEGIGAGDIYQHVAVLLCLTVALGIGHGFSRPVSGMLVHSREIVEKGAFTYIGVACYGDYFIIRCLFFYLQSGIHSSHSDGLFGQTHFNTPFSFFIRQFHI